jgi:peptidoglycan/xylan/chitin deacetylase (PgdA/CDA1 family)
LKYLSLRSVLFLSRPIAFILFAFAVTGCGKSVNDHGKSGIAISFDDHFIDEWYALRPLFQKYQARVTFFITCSDSLSGEEISKLKQLEKDGHEIGFHSTNHGKSTELIGAYGPAKYAEMELEPGLKYMKNAGFSPLSYAHPGGNHNDQVDSVLFASGFRILRDVAVSRRQLFGYQIYALAPRLMSWIFYSFDGEKNVDALLIDSDAGLSEVEMNEAIEKAKNTNTTLMLFGHEPLYKAPENGEYGFYVTFLEKILKEADRQKLKFYTMSELVEAK